MPDNHVWPGGWYVYEDGRINGPLAAEEAFCLEAEAPSGKPRMISRKGFSQWYALKDLSEIFRLTENLGRKVKDSASENFKQSSEQPVKTPEIKARVIHQPIVPNPPAIAPTAQSTLNLNADNSRKIEAPTSTPATSKLDTIPSVELTDIKSTHKTTSEPISIPPKSLVNATLMQEYLIQRTKLHLGKIKNPWVLAFGGLPATFGLLWVFWMYEVVQEIRQHCSASRKNSVSLAFPPSFLAIVPIVHFFMVWRLAKLVIAMEKQNHYQSVSAIYAVTLAIFPPLAMVYLQDAVNKHWLLHVRHSIVKSSRTSVNEPITNH